jgi:Sec-independent protein translocase protein TatA
MWNYPVLTRRNHMRHINLQLFAEGAPAEPTPAPAPSPAPAPEPVQPAMSVDDQLTKLFTESMAEPPAVAVQPPAATPAPVQVPEVTPTPELSLPENFKNVGEVVRSLKNTQAELTKKSQIAADLQKTVDQIKADYEAKIQALQTPPAQPPKDELEDKTPEELADMLMADPKGFIAKMTEAAVQKAVAPLQSKLDPVVQSHEVQALRELWDEAVTEFQTANADMPEFIDGMKEYIQKNNLNGSKEPGKVLENAYVYAKGLKYSAPVDPATLLNDPEFVNKNILTNPAIKEAILKAHMQEISGNKLPPVITGSSNGVNVATPPPARPNNIDEAGNQFESMLRGNFSK